MKIPCSLNSSDCINLIAEVLACVDGITFEMRFDSEFAHVIVLWLSWASHLIRKMMKTGKISGRVDRHNNSISIFVSAPADN